MPIIVGMFASVSTLGENMSTHLNPLFEVASIPYDAHHNNSGVRKANLSATNLLVQEIKRLRAENNALNAQVRGYERASKRVMNQVCYVLLKHMTCTHLHTHTCMHMTYTHLHPHVDIEIKDINECIYLNRCLRRTQPIGILLHSNNFVKSILR